jgi:hypothetical protein
MAIKRMTALRRSKPVRRVSDKKRKVDVIVGKVFREIEERDGDCRLGLSCHVNERFYEAYHRLIGPCEGDPQPAHLPMWRRSKATGVHSRVTIVRLCARHHRGLDTHLFDLDYNPTAGADGYLVPVPHVKRGAA